MKEGGYIKRNGVPSAIPLRNNKILFIYQHFFLLNKSTTLLTSSFFQKKNKNDTYLHIITSLPFMDYIKQNFAYKFI